MLKATLSLNESISFDVGSMIIKLLVALVLPVILAQVLRLLLGERVLKVSSYRKAVSQGVVLVIGLTGAASASESLKGNLGLVALVVLLGASLHIIMLLISWLYLKLTKAKHESKCAVLFTATQKTLPSSLLVWKSYFSSYALAPLVPVMYHTTQLIIDSFIVNKLSRRNSDDKQE